MRDIGELKCVLEPDPKTEDSKFRSGIKKI
jgi:hypothetical protein